MPIQCDKCHEPIEPHVAHCVEEERKPWTIKPRLNLYHPECCDECMARLQSLTKVSVNDEHSD